MKKNMCILMEINGKQNQVEKINILGLESDDF